MKQVDGDLIAMAQEGNFDVIVHGCNCFHAMDAGIAKVIARNFPKAKEADLATPKGEPEKLGTISQASFKCGAHRLTVVNAYTQFDYKGAGRLVDYDAVERAFRTVADAHTGARIAYPKIGAGLAGGDWTKISQLIDAALDGLDHTLVTLP